MKTVNGFLRECNVEDVQKYDALDVWTSIDISSSVSMRALNDDTQIELLFDGDKVIGALSEIDSKPLLPYVQMGYADIFTCKISHKSEQSAETPKLKVVIKLVKK